MVSIRTKDEIKEEPEVKQEPESGSSDDSSEDDEDTYEAIMRRREKSKLKSSEALSKSGIKDHLTTISSAVNVSKPKQPSSNRKRPAPAHAPSRTIPTRRSMRLVKSEEGKKEVEEIEKKRIMLSELNYYSGTQLYKDAVDIADGEVDMFSTSSKDDAKSLERIKSNLKMLKSMEEAKYNLEVEEEASSNVSTNKFVQNAQKSVGRSCQFRKITAKRIATIDLSTSVVDQLIAVGDTVGNIGVWQFGNKKPEAQDANSFQIKVDNNVIRHMKFSPVNNSQLYFCSSTGRIRSIDLNTTKLSSCITINDEALYHFDFLDSECNNAVVACDKG